MDTGSERAAARVSPVTVAAEALPSPPSPPRPAGRRPDPEPLPDDGVRTVTAGTVVWLVVLVVLLPFWSRLRHDGHLWWVATAAIGLGLGLFGVVYCRRRSAALRRLGRNPGA